MLCYVKLIILSVACKMISRKIRSTIPFLRNKTQLYKQVVDCRKENTMLLKQKLQRVCILGDVDTIL